MNLDTPRLNWLVSDFASATDRMGSGFVDAGLDFTVVRDHVRPPGPFARTGGGREVTHGLGRDLIDDASAVRVSLGKSR